MANEIILVVDDSPTDLTLMTHPLQASGYHVITARDGEEAVQKALEAHPQLIVLDVVLPKQNGYQVCRTLRSRPESQDIPILLLTSKRLAADRFWGLKQGASAYLCKPFDGRTLVAQVSHLLWASASDRTEAVGS